MSSPSDMSILQSVFHLSSFAIRLVQSSIDLIRSERSQFYNSLKQDFQKSNRFPSRSKFQYSQKNNHVTIVKDKKSTSLSHRKKYQTVSKVQYVWRQKVSPSPILSIPIQPEKAVVPSPELTTSEPTTITIVGEVTELGKQDVQTVTSSPLNVEAALFVPRRNFPAPPFSSVFDIPNVHISHEELRNEVTSHKDPSDGSSKRKILCRPPSPTVEELFGPPPKPPKAKPKDKTIEDGKDSLRVSARSRAKNHDPNFIWF